MLDLAARPRIAGLALCSLLLVPACKDGPAGEGDEAQGETVGDGDGEPPTGECTVSVVDHSQSCADGCPILSDLLVHCDDTAFGDRGLRVAPEPNADRLYFVTAGSNYAWFGALASDASGELEVLPEGFTGKFIALAQDPAGAPFAAADQTQFGPTYAGGVVIRDLLDRSEELVFDAPDRYLPLLDFEFDTQGRAHVWIKTVAPDERRRFVRAAAGGWTSEPAPAPGERRWKRFGLTSEDAPVAFGFVESPTNDWRLHVDEGAGAYSIGSSFGTRYPDAYALAVPPTLPSLAVGEPRYLRFSQSMTGFRVVAPTAEGYVERLIAKATAVEYDCPTEAAFKNGCPQSCEELAVGLLDRQVAVARTSDGRIWAAWAVTHFDQTWVYTERCDEEVGCWCETSVSRDDNWGEIVLAQVDVENGGVVEVLRVDTLDPELTGASTRSDEVARTFDMRAFDDRLAIGQRIRSVERGALAPDMRLLHIDTSLIP